MSDILQRLKDAYQRNPAEAFELLPELVDAIGKTVVELPALPGKIVFVNSGCLILHDDEPFTRCEVVNVRKGKTGNWKIYLRPMIAKTLGSRNHSIFTASAIGITVFLTRTEAEAAMERSRNADSQSVPPPDGSDAK